MNKMLQFMIMVKPNNKAKALHSNCKSTFKASEAHDLTDSADKFLSNKEKKSLKSYKLTE